MTAAPAAYLNIAVEPTPNSVRSYVAPAIGRGSPRAFGMSSTGVEKRDASNSGH